MSLISGFQISRAIASLLTEAAAATPEGKRAIYKIKEIGESAVPKLIEALGEAESTAVLEQLLTGFVRNSNLPVYLKALSGGNQRVIDCITRVLSRSSDYNVNELLNYFDDAEVSKSALGEILKAHQARINPNQLLTLLDSATSKVRPIIYRLLDGLVNEALIPSIVRKLDSDQPMVRAHLLNLLSRFDSGPSRDGLVKGLKDPNKAVRQAALTGLAAMKATANVADICKLLGDPDITVQSTAIDTLAKIRAPETIKHLIPALQDESEYVRRAAVEVLNEVGDQSAVKDLLNALRDADWWVKVRAADALGTIGGPKVFDAVLALIKDKDEFLRRTAVEILNTSKDPRAVDRLIEALRDEDWWVRERAVDALAAIGDTRAVPYLIEMLGENPEAGQVVIRALTTLGDKQAIGPLLKQLEASDNTLRKEALKALEKLTDAETVKDVQHAASQLIGMNTDEVGNVADETMRSLIMRFGDKRGSGQKPGRAAQFAEDPLTETLDTSQKTIAFEKSGGSKGNAISNDSSGGKLPASLLPGLTESDAIVSDILDPSKLVPNMILGDRYHVIRKIGEGAFGVVWLVEDVMVNDQFILKFLNPHVAGDNNMIQRFMHELRYARKITHDNIIRIYDLVTLGKSYAISMEYFQSHSLADELRDNRRKKSPFDINRGIKLLLAICSGMTRAQEAGVVHRDLKPANILINDNDLVKIVDFGLAAAARTADSRLTKSGILVGTPTYMAPEQVRGKQIDSRTDIYTTGVIMYEMFVGHAPYQGEESMAILFQHVEGKATPPREINPNIPKELEAVIVKAMAVNPEDRYDSFAILHQQLNALLQG